MKKFIAYFLSIVFALLLNTPLASANYEFHSASDIREARREIIKVLRENRNQPSRLSELRLELEAIKQAVREYRLKQRAKRLEARKKRLALRSLNLEIEPQESPSGNVVETHNGIASYYADKFNGRTTASGEVFYNHLLTAAHRTLPFGTRVRVVNPENGQSVEVIINDRGPYVDGRIIDLSSAAFSQLANLSRGVLNVRVEILD